MLPGNGRAMLAPTKCPVGAAIGRPLPGGILHRETDSSLRAESSKKFSLSVCVSHTHTRRCSSALALAAITLTLCLCLYLILYLYLILFLAYLLTVCLRFGSAEKTSAFPRVFSSLPESFLIHRHFVIQQPQSWDEITPEPPPAYSKSRPAQSQTCLGTIIVFFPIRNGFFDYASVVCLPSASIFISNSLRVAPRSE